MSIIIFFIILLVLVLVHEFGHFFTAKRFGIRVDEFGFGFPPKLFSKKFGETEYSFNLLPIGGFVKIFGENPDEENTTGPDANRSFVNKPRWQQAIVLFAGVFANFVLAWILFSIGFMSGFPASVEGVAGRYELQDVSLVVVAVLPDSPAEDAGLQSGDKILSVKNLSSEPVADSGAVLENPTPETFKQFITSNSSPAEIEYARGKQGSVAMATVLAEQNERGERAIGIAMDYVGVAKLSFFRAFYEGMVFTSNVTKATVVGLYTLIADGLRGDGSFDSVTGPVGMVGIVGDAYEFGFVYLLSFAALISINLAIINLVPFPALDGGRLFFLLIEKIKGSRMNPKVANTANMIGFALLILLMLVVTYKDIIKLF